MPDLSQWQEVTVSAKESITETRLGQHIGDLLYFPTKGVSEASSFFSSFHYKTTQMYGRKINVKLSFIYGFFWWQGTTLLQPSQHVKGVCREETCSWNTDSRGGCLWGPVADIQSPYSWSGRRCKLRVSQGGGLRGSYRGPSLPRCCGPGLRVERCPRKKIR